MRSCPHCRREVDDRATVCPHADCGLPLDAPARSSGVQRPPPRPTYRRTGSPGGGTPDAAASGATGSSGPTQPRAPAPPPPRPTGGTGRRPQEVSDAAAAAQGPAGGPPAPLPPSGTSPTPASAAPGIGSPGGSAPQPRSSAGVTVEADAPPAGPADTSPRASAATPGPSDPTEAVLQHKADVLERRVRAGRRRGRRLALGAVALVLVGLLLYAWYHFGTVSAYAELDARPDLQRSATDTDRLVFTYRPTSTGSVNFIHSGEDRGTELLDEVPSDAVGAQQRFEWRIPDIEEDQIVSVTYRRGWSLVEEQLRVPPAPEAGEVPAEPASPASVAFATKRSSVKDAGAVDVKDAGVIVGRIVDLAKKTPLPGAQVRIVGTALSARTDADGRFRIERVPPGPKPIEVAAQGYFPGQIEPKVQEGRATEMELGLTPLYALRTMEHREQWVSQLGGSEASEESVVLGLEWLARHQGADGSWSPRWLSVGDADSRCQADGPCSGRGDGFEMAQSGLAVLAFQAGGHYYFNDRTFSDQVRRGLDWIVAHQQPDGGLLTPSRAGDEYNQYLYDHGIAAFALTEACAVAAALGDTSTPDYQRYRDAAEKAARFIEANQHDDGGWRYRRDPTRPSDSSVTGWQVLALKSAKEAGIPVSDQCVEKTEEFFEGLKTGENGRTNYQQKRIHTEATTGVGMLARQFLFDKPDDPLVGNASRFLAAHAEARWGNFARGTQPDLKERDDKDFYLWYNCTLAMRQVGGEPWERWNRVVRETILRLQRTDGCERGSWDTDSKWGDRGGRIYTTALAVLTLEAYYRYAARNEALPQYIAYPAEGEGSP